MSNQAIISKIKHYFGSFLTKEAYLELIKQDTIVEVLDLLVANPNYTFDLSNYKSLHREDIEFILKDSFCKINKRIYNFTFSKTKEFYKILFLKENLLFLHNSIIENTKSKLVCYDELLEKLDYSNLESVKEALKDTIYVKYLDNIEYLATHIQNIYFEELTIYVLKNYKGKTKTNLLKYINNLINVYNYGIIYRFKRYYSDVIDIKQYIYFNKDFSIADYNKLITCDENSFYKVLKMDKEKLENNSIEFIQDGITYYNAKLKLHLTTSSEIAFLAFYMLQNIEIDNLISIIESKRYSLDKEKIMSMIIM